MAQVFFLQGDLDRAWLQSVSTLEEALRYELIWEPARAQSLMGSILAVWGKQEQAVDNFNKAIHVFRKCGMSLEYARTLHNYALFLLKQGSAEYKSYQQGLSYLREARQVFDECHALLDLQRVERDIAVYMDQREK
jgi:tetratricopeptide (TPR) repeat protein